MKHRIVCNDSSIMDFTNVVVRCDVGNKDVVLDLNSYEIGNSVLDLENCKVTANLLSMCELGKVFSLHGLLNSSSDNAKLLLNNLSYVDVISVMENLAIQVLTKVKILKIPSTNNCDFMLISTDLGKKYLYFSTLNYGIEYNSRLVLNNIEYTNSADALAYFTVTTHVSATIPNGLYCVESYEENCLVEYSSDVETKLAILSQFSELLGVSKTGESLTAMTLGLYLNCIIN